MKDTIIIVTVSFLIVLLFLVKAGISATYASKSDNNANSVLCGNRLK